MVLKKIFFVISVIFNILFILFLLLTVLQVGNTQKINFFLMGTKTRHYLHSALILSVPAEDADVNFGPVEFTLKKDSVASLQFSLIRDNPNDKRAFQSNIALEPLYDPSVISIEPSGFGLLIIGQGTGESTIQIFSNGSFRDIAHITVYDPSLLYD
jgi:hypothetical protein